ncbi:MAG: hydroxymethylbilane synthase [Gemmatimonadales bacterium]
MKRIRIGTRGSTLARSQALMVERSFQERYPGIVTELVVLSTAGDDQPDAPVERLPGIGWFTSTLEQALLDQRINVAVHSYKDLPVESNSALRVAASLPRGPVEDALCTSSSEQLAALPAGARVGSSSLRRRAQLRRLRPDLVYVTLRGNVPTRLDRVRRGDLDAVVLARAGLERLGLREMISEVFPVSRILPAPGQGALAIQTRAADQETSDLALRLDHAPTHRAVRAERQLLRILHGGCSVPVGAYAWLKGSRVCLAAAVFSVTDDTEVRVKVEGPDPEAVAAEAARRLLAGGAGRLLKEATVPNPPEEALR